MTVRAAAATSPASTRLHDRHPDQVESDPDVPLIGGDAGDAVEEGRRHRPGVEPLPDAVGEDLPDLGLRVGGEEDLGGMEDRLHRTPAHPS